MLWYLSTPHTTTGETPSELFIGRKLRTRLTRLLKPNVACGRKNDVKARRPEVKADQKSQDRWFAVGDLVWVRDYRHQQQQWEAGQIIKILGPVTYSVKVSGTEWKRHADQLRPRVPTETTVVSEPQPQGDLQDIPDPSTGDSSETTPFQSSTGDSESSDGAGTYSTGSFYTESEA